MEPNQNSLQENYKNMIGKTIEIKLNDGKTVKILLGDITGDGKIDDEDIKILQILSQGGSTAKALLDSLGPEKLAACDINADGHINREDLLELCKSVVNQLHKPAIEDKLAKLRNKLR